MRLSASFVLPFSPRRSSDRIGTNLQQEDHKFWSCPWPNTVVSNNVVQRRYIKYLGRGVICYGGWRWEFLGDFPLLNMENSWGSLCSDLSYALVTHRPPLHKKDLVGRKIWKPKPKLNIKVPLTYKIIINNSLLFFFLSCSAI